MGGSYFALEMSVSVCVRACVNLYVVVVTMPDIGKMFHHLSCIVQKPLHSHL